jgi:hypothetical protein
VLERLRVSAEGIVYYRSKFARQSPVATLIPGAWQRAIPSRLLRMEKALARWESEEAGER